MQEPNSEHVLFSIPRLLDIADISRTRLYEEINAGRLRVVKVGRRTLVTRAALKAWLEQLEADAPQLEPDKVAPLRAESD